MQLPAPRGPLSSEVIEILCGRSGASPGPTPSDDPLIGDDFHLALYLCYELHYTSIVGVDPDMEWDPALLQLRGHLENAFESSLNTKVPLGEGSPGDVIDKLLATIQQDDGPSLARFIETEATVDQAREFLTHRSAYQLKEADPHSWLIPRIRTAAKAALVEIQADEYGGGHPDRIHSALFAKAMAALDLDDSYGAYVDRLPGITLATVNLMSMFGLHRRLRGAGIGHLAAFETMSAQPNARYAKGLRRLGFGDDALDFFDEHVEADSVHEVIAIHDLVGTLVRDEPELAPDVLWGARCLLLIDKLWAESILGAWRAGRSSLRDESVRATA